MLKGLYTNADLSQSKRLCIHFIAIAKATAWSFTCQAIAYPFAFYPYSQWTYSLEVGDSTCTLHFLKTILFSFVVYLQMIKNLTYRLNLKTNYNKYILLLFTELIL